MYIGARATLIVVMAEISILNEAKIHRLSNYLQ